MGTSLKRRTQSSKAKSWEVVFEALSWRQEVILPLPTQAFSGVKERVKTKFNNFWQALLECVSWQDWSYLAVFLPTAGHHSQLYPKSGSW